MELWITQAWLVASGLISLFLDPKNRKSWWAKPTLVLLIILPAGLAITFGQQKAESARQQALRAEEQHRKDQLEIATLQKQVRDVDDNVRDAVTGIKTILLGFGFTPETAAAATEEQIAISQKANTLVKTAIETSDASSKSERQKITVQYFPKDVDPVVIRDTLSSLGFTFREGTALQREATNAIWFGQDVPLSDVKLVALTLVRAGVDLKTIRPFRKSHPVPDRNLLIQVGTDAEFSGKTSISVSEIANATAFTRPD
jgi:hypothetical protein